MQEPAGRLPLSTWGGLLERARTLTGEPGLGFYLALQKRISGYGYLGFAAMSASSSGEALEIVTRFSPILTTAVSLRLQVERRVAALVVEQHVDMGSVRDVALISLDFRYAASRQNAHGTDIDSVAELIIPEPAVFPTIQTPDAAGTLRPAGQSGGVRRGESRPAAAAGRSRRARAGARRSVSGRSTRSTRETSSSASAARSGTRRARAFARSTRSRRAWRCRRARSGACSPRRACRSRPCSTASGAKRRGSCSTRHESRSRRSPSASGTRRSRTSAAPSISGRGPRPGAYRRDAMRRAGFRPRQRSSLRWCQSTGLALAWIRDMACLENAGLVAKIATRTPIARN